ncbi:MAG TPA: hypothetical protein VK527_03475 [Candidatus Limnocylindrales bacterium]|jgi:hypothetical protein|nr:hypothetical protein [Candidatus Limnocylindrales bacterium]
MDFVLDTNRRSRFSALIPVALAILALALISCTKKESVPQTTSESSTTVTHTVHVNRIDLGRGLTSDRRVITTDQSFTPGDTVYASVVLAPPVAASQVTARWTSSDGQVVYEATQEAMPSETEAVMQFQMVKPAGLALGGYKVEILVDGQVVSTKEFTVVAP